MNPFHEQLLLFFQNDVKEKKREEGWDERVDPELRAFCDEISRLLRNPVALPLDQLIEQRQKLLASRPIHLELQLLRIFPDLKVVRGLPRLYSKLDPSQSKLDPRYTNLFDLKKVVALGALCKLYEQIPFPKDVKIALVGHSYFLEIIEAKILELFPYLKIEKRAENRDDLILEVEGEKIGFQGSGCGLSDHSMGLHFLDRGMILSQEPEQSAVCSNSYFADLRSEEGVFVYFHSLLKFLEDDERDLEVVVPNFDACAAYFSRREAPFEGDYKIKNLIVEMQGSIASRSLSSKGKTVRIVVSDRIPDASAEFFACGNNWSFAKAVSEKKFFFLDFIGEKKSLLKDLIALAKNRLPQIPAVVELLRLYGRISPLQEDDEWVDECRWEDSVDLLQASEEIACALRNDEIKAGFQKLGQILREEFNANGFLIQLISRAVCHRRRPKLAAKERELLFEFMTGKIPFSQLLEAMKEMIF